MQPAPGHRRGPAVRRVPRRPEEGGPGRQGLRRLRTGAHLVAGRRRVLLLIAALFICGMLLSCVIVLLGTQGICAAAAAAGGVTFIAGMLPGPARGGVEVAVVVGHRGPGHGRRVRLHPVLRHRRRRHDHERARPGRGTDPADRRAGHRRYGRAPPAPGRHHLLRPAHGPADALRQGRRHPPARRHLRPRRRPRPQLPRPRHGRRAAYRHRRRPVQQARHPPPADERADRDGRRHGPAGGHRQAARGCHCRSRTRSARSPRPRWEPEWRHGWGRRARTGC